MTYTCTRCSGEASEPWVVCPHCGHTPVAVIRIHGTREHLPDFTPYPEPEAEPFTAKRREQDVNMMKKPQHWPSHVLPMKRYDPVRLQPDLAVWDGVTLLINAVVVEGVFWKEATEQIVATPEEIVALGWTVD